MRKKDLIQLSITAVLIIIFIFAVVSGFKKARSRNAINQERLATKQAPLAPVIPAVGVENKNLYNLLLEQAKSMELKRDPFTAAPIVSERDLHSEIALSGILWDSQKPLAIIDGEVVKKGQRVGGKLIVDIKKDRVILTDGEVLSELKLE